MRVFQSISEPRFAAGDPVRCEEALLEVTRQKTAVLQVLDWFSLGVQHRLYALDDVVASGEERFEKFYMSRERRLAMTRSAWPLVRRTERVEGHTSKEIRTHDITTGIESED